MTKLTADALKKVRENQRLRNRLTLEMEKHPDTIKRWLASNDERLTMAQPLQIISEELGVEKSELLTTN